jgi:hypothetical protein
MSKTVRGGSIDEDHEYISVILLYMVIGLYGYMVRKRFQMFR